MRTRSFLVLLAFTAACSSSENPAVAPGTDGGSHHDGSTMVPHESGVQPDRVPPPDAPGTATCLDAGTGAPGAVCITEVRGRAIDENGAPLQKGQLVSACGSVQCNPGFTDDAGKFSIPVGLFIVPGDYSVQVHKRVDYTAFYFALPSSAKGPVVDLGDVRSLPMPATGPALAVDRAGVPAQTVTSGDVTLEVPNGIYVRLDVESNLADGENPGKGKAFRVLKIPDNRLNEFAAGSVGLEAIYAFEPFECSFEAAGVPDEPVDVRLGFANNTNIPAGTAVDVLALGTYIYPDWIPPAAFTKVAQAHVSTDGSRIAMDPGEGLPYLTWVAVRPTP